MEKMNELSGLEISEISLVNSPATKKTFSVIKGEEKPKCKFNSIQKAFLGYTDDEISELPDEIVEEEKIEKSTKENPFPSITKAVNIAKKRAKDYLDMGSDYNYFLKHNDEMELVEDE